MDITPAEAIVAFIGFLGCCYVCHAMWGYATRDDPDYYFPASHEQLSRWKCREGDLGEDSDDEWE